MRGDKPEHTRGHGIPEVSLGCVDTLKAVASAHDLRTDSVRTYHNSSNPRWPWVIVACAGLAVTGVRADTDRGESTHRADRQPVDPAEVTGRDFAGIRFPMAATPGLLEFRAASAWSWRETSSIAGEEDVLRLVLEGDVRVALGAYEFHAARAAVWLQRIEHAGETVYQVFAYFDRVGTPTAPSGLTITADRLPVRANVVLTGAMRLLADRLQHERPSNEFVRESERALASMLRATIAMEHPSFIEGQPIASAPGASRPGVDRPFAPPGVLDPDSDLARVIGSLATDTPDPPIFASEGMLSIAGDIVIVSGEEENAVLLPSGIVAQYWDRARGRTLQLSAERGVVFLPPGPLKNMASLSARDVRGIYLEGDVRADDGQYSLRSPRVYYDVQRNKALLLDAVFSTFDARRGSVLYLRAASLRQESQNEFGAVGAALSNTAFFVPHLSIGASSVTLTQRDREEGPRETVVDARNITLRGGHVPFFYWPIFVGDPTDIPLRDVSITSSNNTGTGIQTTWNLFGLAGIDAPEGLTADLLLDYFFDRGPGIGGDIEWARSNMRGSIFAYTLPSDSGTDVFSTGAKADRDDEFRGLITARHQQRLDENWSSFAQGWHASDPAFIDAIFTDMATRQRELENSIYLRRLEDNSSLTAIAKGAIDDFTPSQYVLQSQGYTVSKLPEATYGRVADDLLHEITPGLVTHTSEYSVSRMALEFDEIPASERGVTTNRLARDVLGLNNPNESLSDRLRREGLSEDDVYRFDTRHELTMPLAAGPINVTPFVVGRFTAYDTNFESFDPEADEQSRLWGSAGARFHTSIERIDNSVESEFFDLHRLRHVVEPRVTVWHAVSSMEHVSLPVYDYDIEAIAEGSVLAFGVEQRFQTQRGGPGRWRSVDVLTLSADVIVSSDEGDQASEIPRYIDYRPEHSILGDFAQFEAAWHVSDAVAISGSATYDFDVNQPVKSNVGLLVRHSAEFSTYAEMRHIDSEDSTFYLVAAILELTPKYSTTFSAAFDGDDARLERAGIEIRRLFPNAILGVAVNYNNLLDETSLGFSLTPVGLGGRGARLRGLGSTQDSARSTQVGG